MALRALPDGFTEIARGGITLIARDDVREALVNAGTLGETEPSALGRVATELSGGRAAIPVVHVEGLAVPLAIKTLRRGGVLGPLLGTVSSAHRARRELLLNASLRAARVATPAIAAVRVRRSAVPTVARVETFTELIPDAVDLERFLREPRRARERRTVLEAAGRTVAAAHAAGVAHPDLNVRNLLVDRTGAVHVIDLGAGSPASPARVVAALARLGRSAVKRKLFPGIVSRAELARFVREAEGERWRDTFRASAAALRRTLPFHRIAWRLFG